MRTGGIMQKENRGNYQDTEFPIDYALQTFKYLKPHFPQKNDIRILDACSGSGNLGFSVCANCDSKSIGHYDCEIKEGKDIFSQEGKFDIIVCNPPWKLNLALPIYEKLLTLLSDEGVLFFVINNVFLYQGSDRAEKLKFQKFYFLPRWVFKPSGRPLLDCGVAVYHANCELPKKSTQLPCYIPIEKNRKM